MVQSATFRAGWSKLLCLVVMLCFGASAQAPGDIRVALVIGNAAYPGDSMLVNPGNDAHAMASALEGLGFTVIELRDGKKDQMERAITDVRERLKGKRGVGMLFYAGHGVQYDWRNFMIPIDARLRVESDVPAQSIDINAVLDAFQVAGNRLNLVVLDACRNNPFDNKLATKGLAPVDAPLGTFLAFSTAAGNVADDGDTRMGNGLYTHFLLQELRKPSARLEDVFKRVKLQVRERSEGRQIPSETSNLDEEFSFDKGFASSSPEKESVRLDRYRAERAEWDRIKNSQNPRVFFDFLQRYPNGFVSEIAQFRVDQLQKPLLVAQGRRDGVTSLASGTNRFVLGDEFTVVFTDQLTGLSRSEKQIVTLANNDRVEINGGSTIYDQMGGLIKDDSGVKDPPVLMVPADIAPGKRWRSVFQNRFLQFDVNVFVNFKTVGLEELDIGGTKLKAYRVSIEGYAATQGRTGHLTGNLWIEPETMRLVRYDRTLRAGGSIVDSTSMVVMNYIPANR